MVITHLLSALPPQVAPTAAKGSSGWLVVFLQGLLDLSPSKVDQLSGGRQGKLTHLRKGNGSDSGLIRKTH